jgi:hypothetical protein
MPVSSAVINLSSNEAERTQALERLSEDSRIEIGDAQKLFLPVVISTDTLDEGIRLVKKQLPEWEGVDFVRIVRVDFDDATDEETRTNPFQRKE